MKYQHVARYIRETPWAITAEKMHEILSVFAFRAAGGVFTAEEIKARIGDDAAPQQRRAGSVAVVPIRGVIAHRIGSMDDTSGGASVERIAAMTRAVVNDDSVGAVVLDIDSPGGTVQGVGEFAAELYKMRGKKPIVAVANSLAASAAYWIASQADEIVSIPSGITGSIGVFTVHEDLSKMLEQEGVKVTLVSAGKHKVEGNPFEPLSDEAKAVLQARVDEFYGQFVKDVARGRGVSVADVKHGYGEGRALTAKDAKAAGLIDTIATMEQTITRLIGKKSGGLRALASEDLVAALEVSDAELAEQQGAEMERIAAAAVDAALTGDADRARRLRML